ncbi:ATP-binding protein [Williamsia sp. 1135]|uniref:sensor histidine kinase n=1 Tax=Williamsia sp. 1135 TaxID=1889262 RepID=UPI000A0FE272|nr:ATP-binding protein [Williamsia sp. 1135]ORM32821.1 hypothetical protein BFL43_15030 [Williamsia sp. 1135]
MAADTSAVPALRADSSDGSAADNIFRQFCRYLGICYCLSLAFLFGAITTSADVVPLWWMAASLLLIHGSGAVMTVATFGFPIAWVRYTSSALAIAYGLTILTWPLVWDGELIDSAQGMWFSQFNGFAALTAALTWRVRWSLPYFIFVVISVQFINDAVREPAHNSSVLTTTAWSFCLTVLGYTVGVAVMRSGRILDTTRAESVTAAAESAAALARASERTRFDALTHDGVMSTLLAAARLPMSDALTDQAADTLAKLGILESGIPQESEFDVAAAIREIRGMAGDFDDSIRVTVHETAHSEYSQYPGEVVRTVSAAMAEVLRNSLHYAGQEASRTVDVVASENMLRVRVDDDGAGFDPGAVPEHRLGLKVSVLGRMDLLPGGGAEVRSAPGAGTSVELTWERP